MEKKKSWLFIVTFAFLFAGCLGNLYDRIVFGYVRDFIQFAFWQSFPIFNFADTFLTIGIIMFIIYLLIPLFKKQGKNKVMEAETGTIVVEAVDKKDKKEKNVEDEIIIDDKNSENEKSDDSDLKNGDNDNLDKKE